MELVAFLIKGQFEEKIYYVGKKKYIGALYTTQAVISFLYDKKQNWRTSFPMLSTIPTPQTKRKVFYFYSSKSDVKRCGQLPSLSTPLL